MINLIKSLSKRTHLLFNQSFQLLWCRARSFGWSLSASLKDVLSLVCFLFSFKFLPLNGAIILKYAQDDPSWIEIVKWLSETGPIWTLIYQISSVTLTEVNHFQLLSQNRKCLLVVHHEKIDVADATLSSIEVIFQSTIGITPVKPTTVFAKFSAR